MAGLAGEEKRARSGAPDGRPKGGRDVRSSTTRKEQVVLRLLRGEAWTHWRVSGTISGCLDNFLAAGGEGLKGRPQSAEDRLLADAQRKIGELALDNDILRGLIEEMGRHPRFSRR